MYVCAGGQWTGERGSLDLVLSPDGIACALLGSRCRFSFLSRRRACPDVLVLSAKSNTGGVFCDLSRPERRPVEAKGHPCKLSPEPSDVVMSARQDERAAPSRHYVYDECFGRRT